MANVFDFSGDSVTLSGAVPYYSSSNTPINYIDFEYNTGISTLSCNSVTNVSAPFSRFVFESPTGISGQFLIAIQPGETIDDYYTGLRLPPGRTLEAHSEPGGIHTITPGWLQEKAYKLVGSNRYYTSWASATALTTSTLVSNRLYLTPFITPVHREVGNIAFNITTTGIPGSYSWAAIYRDNGNCQPGQLVWQGVTGNVGAAGVKTFTNVNLQLEPGLFWIGLGASGSTPPVFRGFALAGLSTNILGVNSSLGTAQAVGWYVALTTPSGQTLPSYPTVTELTTTPVPALFLNFNR
jgi:hypothetical protein